MPAPSEKMNPARSFAYGTRRSLGVIVVLAVVSAHRIEPGEESAGRRPRRLPAIAASINPGLDETRGEQDVVGTARASGARGKRWAFRPQGVDEVRRHRRCHQLGNDGGRDAPHAVLSSSFFRDLAMTFDVARPASDDDGEREWGRCPTCFNASRAAFSASFGARPMNLACCLVSVEVLELELCPDRDR